MSVAEIIRKVEEIYSVDIETVAPLDDDRLYNFNFLKSNTASMTCWTSSRRCRA